jgi:uncharacterized membrane protein
VFERIYRQRLEADLARWQADGVIAPATGDAIRGTLRPLQEGVTVATVVGIVGGLLIAAAFLAFVAANWTAIARPLRFALLLVGIAGAYGIAAWFDRTGRSYLSDLAVSVGAIVFGAAIALVGQMYHLDEDFAAGLLLWAGGTLAGAALTGSRGALAVALTVGCLWSGVRVFEIADVHLPFLAFWVIAAGLAIAWGSPVAHHLVSTAAVVWLIQSGFGVEWSQYGHFDLTVSAGASFLLGAGLACASGGPGALRAFGATLSDYGAFALALIVAWTVVDPSSGPPFYGRGPYWVPLPILGCGLTGAALALIAGAISRRIGTSLAGAAIIFALGLAAGWDRPAPDHEPWLAYALALATTLCLVVSGLLDDVRPRVVAGWLGLGLTIAAITWAVKGSLLRRSLFLAAAGLVAVALATALGRLLRKEQPQ